MREDFLVFGRPLLGEKEIAEVVATMRSGWIGTGPKVARFERMLAEYSGVEHVRCVSSCTAALFLALKCLGIGPGDEVLVPALTFIATANAVEHVGATPVLVDSADVETGLIDLDAAAAAVTSRTRAIVPVHLYGRPLNMDQLNALRDRFGISVVEDAAHAIGARWRDRPIGSFGNLTAFSFYPNKNITTIEGGALLTDDESIAQRVERLALHGLSAGAWNRFSDAGFRHYVAAEPGYKFNMTDVEASIGIHQLPMLDSWIEVRRLQSETYDQLLADLPLTLPASPDPRSRHARHLYPVVLDQETGISRDEVLDRMTSMNIGVGVHYRGIHTHPYYASRVGDVRAFPIATEVSDRTLSLPLGPAFCEQDLADVAAALHATLTA
ncbi:MAG TPA: DegT/DnrJ/EryC1/StrS family aminotransferase [Mycobacteriales bacterium]|nr:DegT/DnrJ/EryC1/StrS family aminotransferase [Mycobacteriales bacterium]